MNTVAVAAGCVCLVLALLGMVKDARTMKWNDEGKVLAVVIPLSVVFVAGFYGLSLLIR
jgi:uncharacterized membrane protein